MLCVPRYRCDYKWLYLGVKFDGINCSCMSGIGRNTFILLLIPDLRSSIKRGRCKQPRGQYRTRQLLNCIPMTNSNPHQFMIRSILFLLIIKSHCRLYNGAHFVGRVRVGSFKPRYSISARKPAPDKPWNGTGGTVRAGVFIWAHLSRSIFKLSNPFTEPIVLKS